MIPDYLAKGVLALIQVVGSESSRWGLTHRRHYRKLYHLHYTRYRSTLSRVLETLCGCPGASRDALVSLEAQLGDGEIAQFRWWSWAQQWRRHKVLSPLPSNLTSMFPFPFP